MKSSSYHLITVTGVAVLFSLATTVFSKDQDTSINESESNVAKNQLMARIQIIITGSKMVDGLDKETRIRFINATSQGSLQLGENHLMDALDNLTDAEIILPEHPDVLDLKGTIYYKLGDYDRCAEYYDRIKALYPGYWEMDYNCAEIDFVRKNWDAALKGFREARANHADKLDANTTRLIDYKTIICHLKLAQLAEAKNVINKYGYTDASPIFYYGNAAIAFQQDNTEEATTWINDAEDIYPSRINDVYKQSIFTAGWMLTY